MTKLIEQFVNKVEFVSKINEPSLNKLSSSSLAHVQIKIKRTKLERLMLGLIQFNYIPTCSN